MNNSITIKNIYEHLYTLYGPRHWWPGDSPFEVIIGAILTQNTSWKNVEKAIVNLKNAKTLDPRKLYDMDVDVLAEHIRPAGYYNVKAKRIKCFLHWLFENYKGSLPRMFEQDLSFLRKALLTVNGIGPETADSILLYAGNKLTFVVDTYTYRILSRHNIVAEGSTYDEIKFCLEDALPADLQLYNEYHALLVKIGNEFCKPKQKCEECPLKDFQ